MKVHWIFGSVLFVALPLCPGQSLPLPSCSQPDDANGEPAVERIVRDLRSHSFPELTQIDLRMRPFHSQADYFRARFSLARFFAPCGCDTSSRSIPPCSVSKRHLTAYVPSWPTNSRMLLHSATVTEFDALASCGCYPRATPRNLSEGPISKPSIVATGMG